MRYLTNVLIAGSLLAGTPAQALTEINYWLWDQNQPPAYRACADAFEKKTRTSKSKLRRQDGRTIGTHSARRSSPERHRMS